MSEPWGGNWVGGCCDCVLTVAGSIGGRPCSAPGLGQLYKLPHMLLFSILAIVTGCNSYRGIVAFIAVHRCRLNAVFGLKWCLAERDLRGAPDVGRQPQGRNRRGRITNSKRLGLAPPQAYIAHLEQADPDMLLVSCADKLHNARAICTDLRTVGPAVFDRFKGGRDGTLWYYGALSDAFSRLRPGPLAAELTEAVREMRALTAGAEDMAVTP
jgi:hypothetical protein